MSVDVSFILVNYHSEDLTFRCVESIFAKTQGVSFEVIVFDNHSRLNAARFQTRWSKGLRVFVASANLGFGTGCETAARQADGKYLFFLNNDCELLSDAASDFFHFLETHPDAGLVGGQLIDAKNERVASFDYTPTLTSKIIGTGVLRRFFPDKFPLKEAFYRHPLRVDLVSGADLFISKGLYRAVGGFDRRFFLYCEEEDLALRVRHQGRSVYFLPHVQIRHRGGGSSKDVARLKKEFYISYFKFYRKHFGFFRTGILKALTFRQFLWRSLRGDQKDMWRPILFWFLRGASEKESLRYEPGNRDGEPVTSEPTLPKKSRSKKS